MLVVLPKEDSDKEKCLLLEGGSSEGGGGAALLALLAGRIGLPPASGSPARRHFRRTYKAQPLAAARRQQLFAADTWHCLLALLAGI